MAHLLRYAARDDGNPPSSRLSERDLPPSPQKSREVLQRGERQQQQPNGQKQAYQPTPWTSPRSLKQMSLYFAGVTFLSASVFLTRRHMNKRRIAQIPARFTPSNQRPQTSSSGAFDAFEALNLATLNVTAFAIMLVGGLRWSFDVSTMDELRTLVRGGMGVDGTGRSEKDADEEIEEWMASILERKLKKEEQRRIEEEKSGVGFNKRVNQRGRER